MSKLAAGLIVMLFCAFQLADVQADQFEIKPYFAVRGEYNDNIFYAPADETDDYILTIKPGIDLIERTERLDAQVSAEVAPFFYAENSDLNDVDQNYRGRAKYQLTPRLNSRADAFFIVDNRPDRDVLTTGLVQSVDQRERYHFGAGANYLVTEIAALDFAYDWNRDDWDRNVQNQEDLTANVANLGLFYNLEGWLEASMGRINFGYSNYDYDTSETDSFFGGIGLEHMINETLILELDVGARHVSSDFDVLKTNSDTSGMSNGDLDVETESNSGWGMIGQAILDYRGEKTKSNLLISRDLTASSGRRGPTDQFRILFSVYHLLMENMRFGLTSGYYTNEADEGDFSSIEVDEVTFRFRPSFRWEFYDNLTLEGVYSYTYINNKANNRISTQNRVYLQIAYGLPLFEFIDLFSFEGRQVVSGTVPLAEPR